MGQNKPLNICSVHMRMSVEVGEGGGKVVQVFSGKGEVEGRHQNHKEAQMFFCLPPARCVGLQIILFQRLVPAPERKTLRVIFH